jgi:hypothetical protein
MTTLTQPDDRRMHPLGMCLVLLPLLIHAGLLWLHAVNAPRLDDFSEIFTFLPEWHTADSLEDQLTILFRDYQNHRYVLYHALLVLFDGIDFRLATFAGNLSLPVLCALLMLVTRQHPQRHAIWIITPLIVFNLQSWQAMFWGPLGTTNLLYPTLALLGCWLATCGKRGVYAAACVAVLLTFTHGSGPILLAVIAFYLWQQRQVQPGMCLGWLVMSAITLPLYFLAFPLQGETGYPSLPPTELARNVLLHSADVLQGLLTLFGGHLLAHDYHSWKPTFAMAIGLSEILALGWLLHKGVWRHTPTLRLFFLFILLAGLAICASRVAYGGIAQAMQGHYKLLNGLLLWGLLVAVLDFTALWHPSRIQTIRTCSVSIATISYLGGLWLFYTPMTQLQRALLEDVQQWQHSGKLTYSETVLYVKQPNKKLKAAIEGGFYHPDK